LELTLKYGIQLTLVSTTKKCYKQNLGANGSQKQPRDKINVVAKGDNNT
jgi:hypothetical protein